MISYLSDEELELDTKGLFIRVPGTAKTKGSMRSLGKGRMVEQVKGSSAWRRQVATAVAQGLGQRSGPDGPVRLKRPHRGPVCVHVIFQFAPLRANLSRAELDRTLGRMGDLDKLQRNVGDALEDAGLIADDAQIILWKAEKVWAPAGRSAGLTLRVYAPERGDDLTRVHNAVV